MTIILDGLIFDIVECYIDDIVVKSKREQDHLKQPEVVFERLKQHNLKMNPMQCAFGVFSRKFLVSWLQRTAFRLIQAKYKRSLKCHHP
jgi:hypothetical protein